MPYHVFFGFSVGLSKSVYASPGTLARLIEHVDTVEQTLGIRREQYGDNPAHWRFDSGFPKVESDKELCKIVENHNRIVRWLYGDFERWFETPVEDGEEITPEDAQQFWPGLQILHVPPERWTTEYYRARMDTLYEVMRGRECEGVTFDVQKLKPRQAAAVVRLFSEFLDPDDLRLDVPHGHDYLASSYDGGYDWCGTCYRPIHPYDRDDCRRRMCELRTCANCNENVPPNVEFCTECVKQFEPVDDNATTGG